MGLHPLPPKQPLQYPEQILKDELLMVRLKKEKKRRGTWVCDVALVLCPVVEPGDPVPIFPYTILMGVCETRAASSLKAVPNLEEGGEALLRMLGKRMLEKKIPREIQAADSRTYALLKNLADALNIKLVLQPKSSILDELENRFLAFAQAHIPDT